MVRPTAARFVARACLVGYSASALALAGGCRSARAALRDERSALRAVTVNAQAGRGGLERLAAALERLDPDLIGVQEIDVGTRRSGGVDQLAFLASRLGMRSLFGGAMRFDGGAYGVGLLYRPEMRLVAHRTVSLPVPAGAEPRVLLVARLELGADLWVVGVTHFSTRRETRGAAEAHRAQARRVAEVLGGYDRCLLFGDLNGDVRDSAFAPLGIVGRPAGMRLGATYPAREPSQRLDHLFLSRDLVELGSRIVDTGGSDHRALVVDLIERRRLGRPRELDGAARSGHG